MPNGNQKESREEEKEKIATLQGFCLTLLLGSTTSANHVRRGLFFFAPTLCTSRVLAGIHCPWFGDDSSIGLQVPFVGCIGKFGTISMFG